MQNPPDKDIIFIIAMLLVGVFVVGLISGYALTSISYGQAFRNAQIRVCTVQDLDYANLSLAYQRCKAEPKINYALPDITNFS